MNVHVKSPRHRVLIAILLSVVVATAIGLGLYFAREGDSDDSEIARQVQRRQVGKGLGAARRAAEMSEYR